LLALLLLLAREVTCVVLGLTRVQTNIGQNNNKFYVIQLLESDDKKNYWTWNRWGRGISNNMF
jgi:hypothetical protein